MSSTIHWAALPLAGGSIIILTACGGAAFTSATGGDAGGPSDAQSPVDSAAADGGSGPKDSGAHHPDSAVPDGGAAEGGGGVDGGTSPPAPYPLDEVPGATAAYGLRRLASGYAGALVNIARASDGATEDVPPNGDGSFPVDAVALWSKGSALTVVTWYDQAGSHYDVTQGTAAQRPRLNLAAYTEKAQVFAGVTFTATSQTYLAASFPWVSGDGAWTSHTTIVGQTASTGNFQPILQYGTLADGQASLGSGFSVVAEVGGSFDFGIAVYGVNLTSSIATETPAAFTASYAPGASPGGNGGTGEGQGNVDGQMFTGSLGAPAISGTTFDIGGSPGQSGIWFNGSLGDVLLYPSQLTGSQIAELQGDDRMYYGF